MWRGYNPLHISVPFCTSPIPPHPTCTLLRWYVFVSVQASILAFAKMLFDDRHNFEVLVSPQIFNGTLIVWYVQNLKQIRQYAVKMWWPKILFNMATGRHFEFLKCWVLIIPGMTLHQRTKLHPNRLIWRFNDIQDGGRSPSLIIDHVLIIVIRPLFTLFLWYDTKFEWNWTIRYGDMAQKLFLVWRPSAILNVWFFSRPY